MLPLLGAIGFGMLKNPGVTAKYTAKAFGTGVDAVRGGNKLMGKMGSWEKPTKRIIGSAALGYGGYKAGGAVGDFYSDRYLAYEGDTEANQEVAANIRKGARIGGAALGVAAANPGFIGSMAMSVPRAASSLGKGTYGHLSSWAPKGRPAATSRVPGLLKRAVDPTRHSFKKDFGYLGAGMLASVPIVMGVESQIPTNRVSPEGMITGIRSAPRGGISPELQMSTQGLTLGIHNRRKSRVI